LTPASCINYCDSHGYTYAGLEYRYSILRSVVMQLLMALVATNVIVAAVIMARQHLPRRVSVAWRAVGMLTLHAEVLGEPVYTRKIAHEVVLVGYWG
jgi:hypothetical protein